MRAATNEHQRQRATVRELAPVLGVLAVIWVKLICFSLLLPDEWWDQGDSLPRLLRLIPEYGAALLANPHLPWATLACLLAMTAPLVLLPRLLRMPALLLVNFGLTTLALAQLVHFRFNAELFSLADVPAARMLVTVAASVWHFVGPLDALFYADVVVGVLALLYVRWSRWTSPSPPFRTRLSPSLGLLGVGLLVGAPSLTMMAEGARGLADYGTLRIEVASGLGILPYQVVDLVQTVSARGHALGEADYQRVRQQLDARRAPQSPLFGAARGQNVIVISAESLQAFPIGLEIDGQPVTPNLSAFVRESLSFTNFHDQTYLGSTTDAEFATMQSLHPLASGLVTYKYPANTYLGLPRVLADQGYTTVAMAGAPGGFWSMNKTHPRYGFQRGYYEEGFQVGERIGPWMADEEFFRQAAPLLAQTPAPFMAFLLSSSNHQPYDLDARHRRLQLGSLEGTVLGKYLHTVSYFDAAFGELVDDLRRTGLLDTSVIVLYGDHQGFLSDPPELAALLGYERTSELDVFLTRKRVPFIVRLPGGAAAGPRDAAGGHVDLAPTVLSLLGVTDDRVMMLGRDLTAGGDGVVAFRDGSFTDGRSVFISRLGVAATPRCYDVQAHTQVECALLEAQRRGARERLEASDTIIRGNLARYAEAGNSQPAAERRP